MEETMWIAKSIDTPLTRDEYTVWKRWLIYGIGWSYDTLPEQARTLALTCRLHRQFQDFQVRQRDRNRGECALFGTNDPDGRGREDWGTWTLLARWDAKPLLAVPEIKQELRERLSAELNNRVLTFALSAVLISATIIFWADFFLHLNWMSEFAAVGLGMFVGILALMEFFMTIDMRNKTRILLKYISK